MLDPADIVKAYDQYDKRMGSGRVGAATVTPHPDEEPTGEQLSSLYGIAVGPPRRQRGGKHRRGRRHRGQALRSGAECGTGAIRNDQAKSPPYVDFAVWGPYANRNRRRIVFKGWNMAADGSLHIAEVRGPSNFEEWKACFLIWRTAVIMLDIVTPGAADAYVRHIERLNKTFGSSVWLMLYQTDIRFRAEHSERVRRRAQQIYDRLPPGTTGDFDPAQPWDYVYRVAEDEVAFWRNEFETNAIMVRTHIETLPTHLGREVGPVGEAAASSHKRPQTFLREAERETPSKRPSGKGGSSSSFDEGSQMDEEGNYTTNRKGTPLCRNFNKGTCTEVINMQGAPMCAVERSRIHLCSRCLGNHPALGTDGKGGGGKKDRGRGRWSG